MRLLVDDGVDDDGGLAGLAVADDQLALAAADRDQRVDRLDAGLHRLVHRLARNDAGRLHLDAACARRRSAGPCRRSGCRARRPRGRAGRLPTGTSTMRAGAADGVALADGAVVAEDHDADIVGLEVQRHALAGRRRGTPPSRRPSRSAGRTRGRCRHRRRAPGRSRRRSPRCRSWRSAASGFPRSRRDGFPSQAAPFMAYCRRCSRDLRLVSYSRAPMRTTRPPSSDGSTCSCDIDVAVAGLDQPGAQLLALHVGQRMRAGDLARRRRRASPRPGRRRRRRWRAARRAGGWWRSRRRNLHHLAENPAPPAPRAPAAFACRSAGCRAAGADRRSHRSAGPAPASGRRSGPAHARRRPAIERRRVTIDQAAARGDCRAAGGHDLQVPCWGRGPVAAVVGGLLPASRPSSPGFLWCNMAATLKPPVLRRPGARRAARETRRIESAPQ